MEIDIRGIGYHGNPSGQPSDAERLHGVAIQDATNVTVQRSYIRRTYPVKHGNGGIAVSASPRTVLRFDCSIIRSTSTVTGGSNSRGGVT